MRRAESCMQGAFCFHSPVASYEVDRPSQWLATFKQSDLFRNRRRQGFTGGCMSNKRHDVFRNALTVGLLASAVSLAWAPPTHAKVTRIIVDTKVSPAFAGASFGTA